MPPRFIDRYKYILFDICGTLMFDYDRYGPDQDYYPEYARAGGNTLSPAGLAEIINQMTSDIAAAEKVPENWDPFPSTTDFLLHVKAAQHLEAKERSAIKTVFAQHECGTIQDWVVEALHHVHSTHPVGSISNLWSNPAPFEAEIARCGLDGIFQPRIWSSDCGCIKPASRIFAAALAFVLFNPAEVLYVGDTFRCDVYGPKRLGMGVAWVNPSGKPIPAEYGVHPDRTIRSIKDLLHIE